SPIEGFSYGLKGGETASGNAFEGGASGTIAVRQIDFNMMFEKIAAGEIDNEHDGGVFLAQYFHSTAEGQKNVTCFNGAVKRLLNIEGVSLTDFIITISREETVERQCKAAISQAIKQFNADRDIVRFSKEVQSAFKKMNDGSGLGEEYLGYYFGELYTNSANVQAMDVTRLTPILEKVARRIGLEIERREAIHKNTTLLLNETRSAAPANILVQEDSVSMDIRKRYEEKLHTWGWDRGLSDKAAIESHIKQMNEQIGDMARSESNGEFFRATTAYIEYLLNVRIPQFAEDLAEWQSYCAYYYPEYFKDDYLAKTNANKLARIKEAAERRYKALKPQETPKTDMLDDTVKAFEQFNADFNNPDIQLKPGQLAQFSEKLISSMSDDMVRRHLSRLKGTGENRDGAWNEYSTYKGLLRKMAALNERYEILMLMKAGKGCDDPVDAASGGFRTAHEGACRFEAACLYQEAVMSGYTGTAEALLFSRPADLESISLVPSGSRWTSMNKIVAWVTRPKMPTAQDLAKAVDFISKNGLLTPGISARTYWKRTWNKYIFSRIYTEERSGELAAKLGNFFPLLLLRILYIMDDEGYDKFPDLTNEAYEKAVRDILIAINNFIKSKKSFWNFFVEIKDNTCSFMLSGNRSFLINPAGVSSAEEVGLRETVMESLQEVSKTAQTAPVPNPVSPAAAPAPAVPAPVSPAAQQYSKERLAALLAKNNMPKEAVDDITKYFDGLESAIYKDDQEKAAVKKNAWELLGYTLDWYAAAENVLDNFPCDQTVKRNVIMPISADFLPLAPGVGKTKVQALWRELRLILNRDKRFNVNLLTYDGTAGDLGTVLGKVEGKSEDNTIAFVNDSLYDEVNGKKFGITLFRDKLPKSGKGFTPGYFSVGGHISLGLGILGMVEINRKGTIEKGEDDTTHYGRVLSIMRSLNNDKQAEYPGDSAAFIADLKAGKISITLPMISPIEINANMSAYFFMESAIARSL
ncbi:MAG: hypothetical protein HQL28_04815, partial [Candidatus Omnitrophica bacterium]|nr:hypothetical protein [Candidatus Omnitrophota bacterium]